MLHQERLDGVASSCCYLVREDAVLAEKINQAFISVMMDYSPLTDSSRVSADDDDPIVVTEQFVARKLRKVSTSRACGPDYIPNWVLKEYADILAVPIADILNTSETHLKSVYLVYGHWPMFHRYPKRQLSRTLTKIYGQYHLLQPGRRSLRAFLSNPSKCKELQLCFKRSPPIHSPVELDGLAFETVNSAKVLDVTIRDDFKWNDYISNVTSKAAKRSSFILL